MLGKLTTPRTTAMAPVIASNNGSSERSGVSSPYAFSKSAPVLCGIDGGVESATDGAAYLGVAGGLESGNGATSEQKQRAIQTIRDMQKFFGKLGVSELEGNSDDLVVVFKDNFGNAAYLPHPETGKEYIIIGQDPMSGKSFCEAEDVIAHEYAHRVVNNLLGLKTTGEQGAVNESLADTFAAAYDSKDWTIGEGTSRKGMRSMIDPTDSAYDVPDGNGGRMTMPDHVSKYIRTDLDAGGVHINVGIPNKAAALIGESLGREKMAQIYIDAVRNNMTPRSGIADTAVATARSAASLFGNDSRELGAVVDAWRAVGVDPMAAPRQRQQRSPIRLLVVR